MNTYHCIARERDKSGNIIRYQVSDDAGHTFIFNSEQIKDLISSGRVVVANLTLTSNGRLLLTDAKPVNKSSESVHDEFSTKALRYVTAGRALLCIIFKALNEQYISENVKIEKCFFVSDATERMATVYLKSHDTDEDTEITIQVEKPLQVALTKMALGDKYIANKPVYRVRALGRKLKSQDVNEVMQFIAKSLSRRLHSNDTMLVTFDYGSTPPYNANEFEKAVYMQSVRARENQSYDFKPEFIEGQLYDADGYIIDVMGNDVYLGPKNLAARKIVIHNSANVVAMSAFSCCPFLDSVDCGTLVYDTVKYIFNRTKRAVAVKKIR